MPLPLHPMNDVDRVLSLKEVEQILRVSHATFHRSIRPSLPVIRLSPKRLGVRASDLKVWQEKNLLLPAAAA